VTGNESVIQRERLHANDEYIPERVVPMYDEKVHAHMKTRYPK
jgi:hypothetical protein